MKRLDLVDNHRCFACGFDNLDGLRISWEIDRSTMSGYYTPEEKYQGWKGIVHGGILATLLDEAMARLAGVLYQGALTAEMTVRYVAPAVIGEVLYIRGEVVKESRRIIEMKAFIYKGDSSGILIAHSTGKIVR